MRHLSAPLVRGRLEGRARGLSPPTRWTGGGRRGRGRASEAPPFGATPAWLRQRRRWRRWRACLLPRPRRRGNVSPVCRLPRWIRRGRGGASGEGEGPTHAIHQSHHRSIVAVTVVAHGEGVRRGTSREDAVAAEPVPRAVAGTQYTGKEPRRKNVYCQRRTTPPRDGSPPPPSPPCSCYYYNMPRLPATGADQARPPTGGARSARPADAPGGARPPPRRPGAAAGTAGPDRRWPAAAAAAPALRRQWGERHRPGGRCGNLPPLVGQGRHWRGGWLTQWPPRRLPHHPYPSRDSRNYG